MSTPFIYRLGKILGRLVLGFYFRRIEVAGTDRLPRGPLILAANHPQSVTDALVVGLAFPRTLHFVAHSGLFANPVTGFLLRRAGVIPVYRPGDVAGAREKNVEMFQACRRVLEADGAIAIFPEGTSSEERRLQRLRTGTARMALESEDRNQFRLGVGIVPLGIHFESRRRFRSRILLQVGNPVSARDYRERYREDPVAAVEAMTAGIREALVAVVVNLERSDLEGFVDDVDRTYRDELLSKSELSIPGESDLERKMAVTREIARAADRLGRERPDRILRLQRLLTEYRRKRTRLRLSESVLRGEERSVRGEIARMGGVILAGALPAAYGALWNVLPYKLTGWAAKRSAPDETKLHWYQLTRGAFFYGLYYPPLFYGAFLLLGGWGTLIFALSLIPTGFFARWYGGVLVRRGMGWRYARLAATEGALILNVRSLRARIISEMDSMLEEYLHMQETVKPPRSPD